MTITLSIENSDQLADGGPIRFQARQRGFELGREQHLDWTLPDPSRFISGRHCEVRYEKGGYFLYDVSRNGTFLNGAQARMKSPHRLETGDRLQIGHYLIAVSVQDVAAEEDEAGYPEQGNGDQSDSIWDIGAPAPPPVDRREFAPPQSRGRRAPDFAEQYLELPQMHPGTPTPAAPVPKPEGSPFSQPASPVAPPGGAFGAPGQPASESPFGSGPSVPPPAQRAAHPHGEAPAAQEGFIPPVPPARPHPVAPPPPVQPRQPAPPAPSGSAQAAFLEAFASGAGVSPEIFSGRDPREVAHEIGAVMGLVVTQLAGLLKARAAAKAMAKSSKRTMLSAVDNNPLKFIPTAAEMIEVMFAGRPGYLDSRRSIEEAFRDLEAHEIATFAAMQKALSRLLDGFSPQTIEGKLPSSTFSSKKARAWESYVERWDAMTDAHEHGILNVFLSHFAEAYDEATRGRS